MPEIINPGDARIPSRRAARLGYAPDADRRRPLWTEGQGGALALPAIGIVGTRHPSAHGLATARLLATACAEAGWCVVSGMARGIDEAAHRAALMAGGVTIGVLPSPAPIGLRHGARPFVPELLKRGLLLSDRPVGTPAAAWSFVARNTLLAALCDGVLIVEAPEGSGALLTATAAAEMDLPLAFASAPFGLESAAGGLSWVSGPPALSLRLDQRPVPVLVGGIADFQAWLAVCAASLQEDSRARIVGETVSQWSQELAPDGVRGRILKRLLASGADGLSEDGLADLATVSQSALPAALTLLAQHGLVEQGGGRWRATERAVLRSRP
jgi:DNA protecting protein DprA